MEHKLSYYSLAPHLKNLRLGGFCQLSSDSPRLHILFHTVYMRFVLLFLGFYMVQEVIKIYQVRSDANQVMDTMFLFLTNTDSFYKQVTFWIKGDEIEKLLEIMKGPIFNQGSPEHEKLLSKTVKQARIVLRVFNSVAISTCLMWFLYPVVLFIQAKHVDLPFWLPYDANKNQAVFYSTMLYNWVQTTWVAVNNTTMDATISFFLAQSKTQLSILRQDLENLVARSKEEAANSSTPYRNVFRRNFLKIMQHYNEIVNFSGIFQNIFGGVLLYQFLLSGWILCTAAYRTVDMKPASVEFMSMLMYISCILTELFLFCFFGNEVSNESGSLTESAYNMDWLEIPSEHRRSFLIFMERIKRPIQPMGGLFIPLSNSSFVSILRSAYSFYALLKNTA